MVANTKRDGSVRDPNEDEKILRLFVIIPKTFNEDDLKKEFQVRIISEKPTVIVLPYFFGYKTGFISSKNNPKILDPSSKTASGSFYNIHFNNKTEKVKAIR